MNNKVTDGQNISLVDALTRYGFCREGEEYCLQEGGNKKFVLTDLQGTVKELPSLENDENQEAGNSANGEQEINGQKAQRRESEGGDPNPDNIQLAADPIKEHNMDKENTKQTKALEQNGFHVVGEGGGSTGKKESGSSIIVPNEKGSGLKLDTEEDHKKKNKKS
jgi:hypothetical protein